MKWTEKFAMVMIIVTACVIISLIISAIVVVCSVIHDDIKATSLRVKICEEQNIKEGETKILNGKKVVILNQQYWDKNKFDVRLEDGTITTIHIKEFIDQNNITPELPE